MNWVKFKEHYSICEETREIKSHAREVGNRLTGFKKQVPEKILKPQNGFVNIHGKSTKVDKIYKEVFG